MVNEGASVSPAEAEPFIGVAKCDGRLRRSIVWGTGVFCCETFPTARVVKGVQDTSHWAIS
jgi:hypothetical protein